MTILFILSSLLGSDTSPIDSQDLGTPVMWDMSHLPLEILLNCSISELFFERILTVTLIGYLIGNLIGTLVNSLPSYFSSKF